MNSPPRSSPPSPGHVGALLSTAGGAGSRPVCVVDSCGGVIKGRGYCTTHYRRWQVHGDPHPEQPIERKTAGGVSYWSVHQRLKTERGPASAHRCAGCGKPAVDWSYIGGDPAERVDPTRGYRYSTDVTRYRPRCRSCHRRATVERRASSPRSPSLLDVDRVVRLYQAGGTGVGIAALLGVSRNAVYRALRARAVTIRPRGTRGSHVDTGGGTDERH